MLAEPTAGGLRRATPEVVLVHGLWAPALVMAPLAARLAAQGFRCHLFRYAGRGHTLDASAERLRRFALQVGRAHFVGHSLGGLVVVQALDADARIEVGRVVLLGTPARGSFSGRRLARSMLGRWLMGRSTEVWHGRSGVHWRRPESLGVIAGTLPLGLGRALGRLPGANDGVVCVDETVVAGMYDRVVLPVNHSGMIISARVAVQVAAFLRGGRFHHAAA